MPSLWLSDSALSHCDYKTTCPASAVYNKSNYPDLVLAVVLHPWQSGLWSVSAHPAVVGPVGLLDPSVVRDVLSLRVDSVQALVDRLSRVVPVLPDDAVGSLQELV